jgi:excinuclease UvrABC helicase subunit UvrB
MESVFKVYYDALDKLRYEMLGEEYEYLAKMDGLETKLTRTVNNMKNYNIMEFFYEEKELREQLVDFRDDLDSFNVYLPKTRLNVQHMEELSIEITNELDEKMKHLIKQIDHGFAVSNYDYIIKNIRDTRIKEVYKTMGPYDHFAKKDLDD